MCLYKEGIRQVKEALEISERLHDTAGQAWCLLGLALLLHDDDQLYAIQEITSRAIDLFPEKGERFPVCGCNLILGVIYSSKGDTETAIHCFGVALGITSSFSWPNLLFWIHFSLAGPFLDQYWFDDAYPHIEHAKSHAVNHYGTYLLTCVVWLQAML